MTTNEELKKLSTDRDLTGYAIAKILEISERTVYNWLSPPHNTSYREMPSIALQLLKLKLKIKNVTRGTIK